tara:strand:+ start:411 stop:824 length:414 start_codon:yes stop_codon:yes gene_type:complete
MGQVASSSINYDYTYDSADSDNKSNNKNNTDNTEEDSDFKTQEVIVKELLELLKYYSESIDFDNRFILKNKLIVDELSSKLIELDKKIKKNKSQYITGKYQFKSQLDYNRQIQMYTNYLKIAIIIVIVILLIVFFLN